MQAAIEIELKELAADLVKQATARGASAAEAVIAEGTEFSTLVRLGQVETLKEAGSKAAGLRVFFGKRAASTYTSDFSPSGMEQMVSAALALARVTAEDPFAGLPSEGQLGSLKGDLGLYHQDVYSLPTEERIAWAR